MTLTDFLLARIADDEAPTFEIVPDPGNPGYVGHACLICDAGPSFGGTVEAITEIAEEHAEQIHQRSRVLAECAAKRRIVEMGKWATTPTAAMCYGNVILTLAAVYADHPDYDEEWRP